MGLTLMITVGASAWQSKRAFMRRQSALIEEFGEEEYSDYDDEEDFYSDEDYDDELGEEELGAAPAPAAA